MPKVGEEWRELARQMAANPSNYRKFDNLEKKLPKAVDSQYYIEGTVSVGNTISTGQYRVVCLVGKDHGKLRVLKKYCSRTHYGTGVDAGKEEPFVEFTNS
jgi:guanyl-specific ribonuclease Sa